jgi:hypothetical protein
VAHEACHVRQFREGLRRSEVEAERWAESLLERWRCAGMTLEPGPDLASIRDAFVQLQLPSFETP